MTGAATHDYVLGPPSLVGPTPCRTCALLCSIRLEVATRRRSPHELHTHICNSLGDNARMNHTEYVTRRSLHTSTAECFAVAVLSMALFLVGAGCATEEKGAVEEEDLPLAQVGDVIITAKQLREFSTALTGGELTGEARSERLRAHLQTMIDREILSKEAKKSGIQEDASFIQKMRKIRNSKLLQLFAVKQIKVGRDAGEVAEFIEKGRLTRAVKFSQIVVDSEEDAKAVTEEIRSGTTFEDAAEKWSRAEEATLVIGGREDGYSTKVNTHPSVRERLFSLEVGAVSEPIELS